jgi:hypothetical protein
MAKKVIWQALEGNQGLALNCPCNHILLHGTRGSGKSDVQLMYFRRFVGQGYGHAWRGIIFDREYKNLEDLIAKSRRWFPQFKDGARFLANNSQLKWVWPTGEELFFRTLAKEEDYWRYHGHEYAYIGHNELTKNPNGSLYDMIMSCNRTSFIPEDNPIKMADGSVKILPEIPLVVLSTTNPYGVGRNWIKQKFIDKAESGEIFYKEAEIFNPRTQKKEILRKSFVHLFMSYKDNKYLSPEYVLELESITDPNKRKAWLEGDWDITSGGMFDDVFKTNKNVVKPFNIPQSWKIFRSFDWGSSKPFSVGWWAESDGSDYMANDGSYHSTIRGDLFRIGEWYGWNGEANTGLRMLNVEIATHIVKREIGMGIFNRVVAGPADNSVNDIIDGKSVAMQMGKSVKIDGKQYRGVTWTKSNKKAGSRKLGWELMRQGFANATPDEGSLIRDKPAIFIFNTCQDGFLRTVPSIPRDLKDPDDVDTDSEDHCADESRYAVLSTENRFASDSNRVLGAY